MYIFELIAKYLKGKDYSKINNYNPVGNGTELLTEDVEDCEHLFLPLDSSNTMFACKYCGLVVSKEKLKNINIFEKDILN